MKASDFLDPLRADQRSYEKWLRDVGGGQQLAEWRRLQELSATAFARDAVMGTSSLRAAEAALASGGLQAARQVLDGYASAQPPQAELIPRAALDEMKRRAGFLTSVADLASTWSSMTGSAVLAAAQGAMPSMLDRELGKLRADSEKLSQAMMGTLPAAHLGLPPELHGRASLGDKLTQAVGSAAGFMQEALARAMGTMDAAQVTALRDRAIGRMSMASSQGDLLAGLIASEERERLKFIEALTGTSGTLDSLMAAIGAQNRMPLPEAPTPLAMLAAEMLLERATHEVAQDGEPGQQPSEGEPSLRALLQQVANDVATMERDAPNAAQAAFRKSVWLAVVILLLTLVLTPVADFYIKRWLEAAHRQPEPRSKKDLVEAARAVVQDLQVLDGYRFVYGRPRVKVLRSASARALVIGQLPAGSTVQVLEVRGSFTHVEWTAADGQATVTGWVFSRYLRKFA